MVSCAARSERVTSSETEWLITSHSLRRNLLSSISSLFQDMDLYIYIYTYARRKARDNNIFDRSRDYRGFRLDGKLLRERFEGK